MAIIFSEYKNQVYSYIAFFDLDMTLTKAISGRALAQRAFKNGLMNGHDIANAIYLSLAYRLGYADPVKIMGKMLGWVKELPEQKLTDLCSEVLHEVLVPSVYSEVNNELEMHKSRNAKTVILSSSLVQICQGMAVHLKMDDIICSKLEVREGFMTGHPEGNLCYGYEKSVRLKEYCERNNNKTENAWYYGDSISDLPALEVVGHPVCINPDRQLRKKATEKEWKIFLWDRNNIKSK
jgi:HAD superfamily hydrolase (TIGR01490 family)